MTDLMTEAEDIRDLLRDSLSTLLSRQYSFDQRRDAHSSATHESQTAWAAYAELGLFALTLPEEHGGIPGKLADIALVADMMGGAMTLEPYVANIVGARLIAAAGTPAQREEHLPAIASGECRAVLAHDRAGQTRADRTSTGWRLNGRTTVIAGGDTADLFIISAQTDDGVALFLAPADAITDHAFVAAVVGAAVFVIVTTVVAVGSGGKGEQDDSGEGDELVHVWPPVKETPRRPHP